ncbi:hypothetical protein M5585_13795 [Serratia ureilytica]
MFVLGDRALLLVANPYYRGKHPIAPSGGLAAAGRGAEIQLALPAVGTATLWLQR